MSDLIIDRAALAMICQTTSPTPIGQTPGFLSSTINLQATKGEIIVGSTKDVHNLLAKVAIEQKRNRNVAIHKHQLQMLQQLLR